MPTKGGKPGLGLQVTALKPTRISIRGRSVPFARADDQGSSDLAQVQVLKSINAAKILSRPKSVSFGTYQVASFGSAQNIGDCATSYNQLARMENGPMGSKPLLGYLCRGFHESLTAESIRHPAAVAFMHFWLLQLFR